MPVDVLEIGTTGMVTEIVTAEIATAAVKSELEMFVAEQAKTMAANLIRLV